MLDAKQNHFMREDQRMERLRYWKDHLTCLNPENFDMDSVR